MLAVFLASGLAFQHSVVPLTRIHRIERQAAVVRGQAGVMRGSPDSPDRASQLRIDQKVVRTVQKFLGTGPYKKIVCGRNKYGCDPRTGDANVSDVGPFAADGAFPRVEPGLVGQLQGGTPHLNALLKAAGDDRAVILKFKREGCPACNSTVAPLASAASAYAGRVDFVTVDYNDNRAFCRKCALAVVPSAHIYLKGELAAAMPLGPSKWQEFARTMEELIGAPDGEVLEAKIPEKKNDVTGISVTGIDFYL